MWKSLALEARYELTKLVRLPMFVFMALGFPVAFYLMFAVALSGTRATGGRSIALPMLGTYGAFGVVGAALFSFGIGVAVERAQGWLLLKRASAMHPMVYVGGKVAACAAFCGVIVRAMSLCATLLAGVRLAPSQWTALTAALVFGSIPFSALGLAVGFAAGPNSAPGIVNLLHLPGAFLGGLWMPLDVLPRALQNVAPFFPQYHLGQLALTTIGQSDLPEPAWNVLCLAAWTLVSIGLAALAFKRDQGVLYG
jgi:ABC-2 type transport system permease protein